MFISSLLTLSVWSEERKKIEQENYIRILKRALREAVEENDKLHERYERLEKEFQS